MPAVRVCPTGFGPITKAYRENCVRIKIHPLCERDMPIQSSFQVASQCVVPLVERARVCWNTNMRGWEFVDEDRFIKESAVVSRLCAPAIDCLIIGELRRDVFGELRCAQSDVKPVECFLLNRRIRWRKLTRT